MQPAEQNTTMKENQNATFSYTKYSGREADSLPYESTEIYLLKGSKRDTSPLAFGVKGGAECLHLEYVDDLSIDCENVNGDSARKKHQNELSYCGVGNNVDSLSFEINDKDKMQDHDCPMNVEELANCNKNASKYPNSLCTSASDLFKTETDKHSANSELQCELPKLIVCNKEINCQRVKDICVDKGMPAEDKNLVDSCKDDNTHSVATEEGLDIFISDKVAESTKVVNEDEFFKNEESYRNTMARGRLKLVPESFSDKDIAKYYDSDNSLQQTTEANIGDTSNIITNFLEEESFVDKTLPVQEFGTRSFLRSFLSSLDIGDNEVAQHSDQIPSGIAVSGVLPSLSTEMEAKIVGSASYLVYNSKVESGSITFNFSPPSALVSGSGFTTETMEDVNELSVHSGDVHEHKGANAGQVSIENPHDRFINTKHDNSIDSSATTQVQCISSNDTNDKNIHKQFPVHNDSNSPSSTNDDGHSDVEQLQYDEGESSFSAAGLINDSGPIPNSGSLSHCSDGSTTSGRSFAFPVLQSEWNSSPTRMAKADGRHFRKHRGWRSGLLCCRF